MNAAGGKNTRRNSGAWFGAWLARPLADFHLVVTITTLLTTLGLVMVLSASSVESYADDGSAYSLFIQQAIFAALGAVLFYLALRVPMRVLRRLSFPLFAISVLALILVLVPGVGSEAQGSRRWFSLGFVHLQPSEVAKITLIVWGAHLLAAKRPTGGKLPGYKEIMLPLVPAGLLVCLLIVLEPNLSTTIAVGIILAALLWFGGLPARMFVTIGVSGLIAAGVLALTAGYRSDRMRGFFNPSQDPQGIGYQARQALFSLADGGIWGRGLGQSRAKWSYLPNAHNDFIFAIIGEELGFLGCALVLGLFALFVYTGLRIASRSVDPFLRLLTATATTWITGQALINIGYVVGLLPVTGLQLPLVSAGGSSLAITLLMFGIIANAARHEPEAIAALQAGQHGRFSRLLRLPMPERYSVARAQAAGSARSQAANSARSQAANSARAQAANSARSQAANSARAQAAGSKRSQAAGGTRSQAANSVRSQSGTRKEVPPNGRGGPEPASRRSIDSDSARRRAASGRRESHSTRSLRSTRAWEPSYPTTHARERGKPK